MAVNVKVVAQPGESGDALLRRFKKAVTKDGLLFECKRRQYFMNRKEKRKYKQEMAIRRAKNKKLR